MKRQTLMLVGGVVFVAIGIVLVVGSFLLDTSGRLGTANPPIEVGGNDPTSTSTSAPAPPPARTFSLAATGDLLAQEPVNARAAEIGAYWDGDYDLRPMFDDVRPIIGTADLALCHLETPLAAPGDPVLSGDDGRFSAPNELGWAIADAGYDGCSTASNHALDMGRDGVQATLDEFDVQKIGYAGTARTADEARVPRIHTVNGVRVAHLSYTYGLGADASLPPADEYLVNIIDPERIERDAGAAREAGANVVIVSLHWGDDFESAPSATQLVLAQRLSEVPEISLVIGHHSHVVQPITKVGNLVVAYGLGNFLSAQRESSCCPAASQDGVIAQFRFDETGPGSNQFSITDIEYTATRVDHDNFTIVPVESAFSDPDLTDSSRQQLEASRDRTNAAVGMLGLLAHPSGK